ncbi:glycosyltransferase [Scytonema sp. UIC 10036]|uniref:glycosyltransferase family 2 protein n=1 Tax=Scytonema sp. UIC 10036 TaxID=2304196 RepID=UPI0012DA82FA|nr:glycosyltransferase [Scytonema sp. UIC 10036]MUG99156.1 glycosyltransferase [Scytonema sp. UIC 10036]
MLPKISVIIPAYNAKRTILETIQSVQQQTFSNFEIIVINDGSTDNTLELLQSVKDKRLKVFSYENGGLPVARNRGITHAMGEFLAFLDADDKWTPDKLELQLTALQERSEAGLAYSWTYYWYEEQNSVSPSTPVFFEGNVQANLLVNNFIANGSNPLIRKQAIESTGEFDPTLKSCEDWDYWLRLATHWNFVVVPKHQVYYRISSISMSSKVNVMEEAALIVVEKAFQDVPVELQHLKNQSLAGVYQYCTHQCLQNSGKSRHIVNQAAKKLWLAIRLHPPILLEKYTQSLLRWLLKKWILMFQVKRSHFTEYIR